MASGRRTHHHHGPAREAARLAGSGQRPCGGEGGEADRAEALPAGREFDCDTQDKLPVPEGIEYMFASSTSIPTNTCQVFDW